MDDTITNYILYGDNPPEKVYFVVQVEYNPDHSVFGGSVALGEGLETAPIKTFGEAVSATDTIANRLIKDTFSTATLIPVQPSANHDIMYYIKSPDGDIIARVGINTIDNRAQTFH